MFATKADADSYLSSPPTGWADNANSILLQAGRTLNADVRFEYPAEALVNLPVTATEKMKNANIEFGSIIF